MLKGGREMDLNESLKWALKKNNKTGKEIGYKVMEGIEDIQIISNLHKMKVHGEEKMKRN